MKKIVLILAILFIVHYVQAQVATKLSVADTRESNTSPSGYSQEAKFEFKKRSVVGVPGDGHCSCMLTFAPWANDNSGNKFHQLNFNDGGLFYRNGFSNSASWDVWRKIVTLDTAGRLGIGINSPSSMLHIRTPNYSTQGLIVESDNAIIKYNDHAISLSSKSTWGSVPYIEWKTSNGLRQAYLGWTPNVFSLVLENGFLFSINGGNVVIGKTTQSNPLYKLDVAGKVRADEITVNTNGADFVFENGYNLRPLDEVESFIKANKHLPGIAPASEMQKNGTSIGEMNTKLLQKVEELTLYLIEKDKEIRELKEEINNLKINIRK